MSSKLDQGAGIQFSKGCGQITPAPRTPLVKKQPNGMALEYGLLKTMGELPVMPHIIFKAQEIISDKDSSAKELARVIEVEPSVTTKILKLANSAYYGLSGKVSSIRHACSLIGYKTLGEIITLAAISNMMDKRLKGYELDSGTLWRHSLAVALGSKNIAKKRYPDLGIAAFTTGIIHDVGKLMLDQQVCDRKGAFELFMGDGQKTFLDAEKHILGFDHAHIAAEFCHKWNITKMQSQAVRYHHCPSRSQDNTLAYILHVADVIAMRCDLGTGMDSMLYQVEKGALEFLGLRKEDESEIISDVYESVGKIEEILR